MRIEEKQGKESITDLIFEIMFRHQTPRVEFYSTVLREAFGRSAQMSSAKSLTSDVMKHLAMGPVSPRRWEDNHGLKFEFGLPNTNEARGSDVAADCLSRQEDENLVDETFREVQELFHVVSSAASRAATPSPKLVKSLCTIIQHPRQRPAFKGLLRQALHEQTFQKAWSSLLFLSRIYYAAATMTDLVSRSNSIRFYDFDEVPHGFRKPPKISHDRRALAKALESLGCLPLTKDWMNFFQNKVGEYARMLAEGKGVHAETQLICYLSVRPSLPERHRGTVFPYVGCSKKCCFFCEEFRCCNGPFEARGTHGVVFSKWALPQGAASADSDQYLSLLRQFSQRLKAQLRAELSRPPPLRQGNLLQQSSAALSTTKGVQAIEPSYPERPSVVTYDSRGFL